MTRKQRGVKERKRSKKISNFDRSKYRSSKKRKFKNKYIKQKMW